MLARYFVAKKVDEVCFKVEAVMFYSFLFWIIL